MLPRRLLLVCSATFLIASVVACCGLLNPASRLYGKWKWDVDEAFDGAIGNLMNLSAVGMTVDFRSDGTATVEAKWALGSGAQVGKWAVTSAEGDVLNVDFTPDNSEQTQQFTLTMIDADTFKMKDTGQGNSAIFRRVKE